MARWAIGDIQGCAAELRGLLARLRFNPDRDTLWFTGDIVNRGPDSLGALRLVHALRDNAVVVLGNHDLHLLALVQAGGRPRRGDTLDEVLAARDRHRLFDWLIGLPLAHHDAAQGDLLVHAGLVPQWSVADVLVLAADVRAALRGDPAAFFAGMYGNRPDTWSEDLAGMARLRFTVNVLTRARLCTAAGRINLEDKGPPQAARAPWRPWYRHRHRASAGTRVVFGHWSTLGFHAGDNVLALDTGCVWGGALTAIDLDVRGAQPLSEPSRQPRRFGAA
ncbi:MAG: symmetrical bis(5'-nucleosyl)-tetraphosphatase [Gammaproteobacteria bacterium]|nr:symmetrical bis(5'-nucleosyl)-tetraphosphatase [Gammaproteobacteria bacterium]